ncbi:MAG: PKD domain-containing protein [Ktedonobacterales bacterium]
MQWIQRRAARPRLRRALPLVGIAVALWAALAQGTPGALPFAAPRVAYGCGLGQTPTMLANTFAAMLNPGSQTSSATAPILGVFGPTFLANQPITFDEDLSQVPNAPAKSSIQLTWDFGDGGKGSGFDLKHTYAKPGTYAVFSFIPGDPEPFDSANITVIATPFTNPPVAAIQASATAVAAGTQVSFDASGSRALAGGSLTYSWNFADGDTASGVKVTHTFTGAKFGKSFVSLIVTDSRGARSVATSPIIVVQQLPKAALAASSTDLGTGENVTFDASQSSAPTVPPGDQLASYTWSFGDGSPALNTTTPTVTHAYHKAGTFTASVRVYDQQGAYASATVKLGVVAIGGSSGGTPWPLYGGVLALLALLIGGYFALRAQRRQAAIARYSAAKMELARSRRVPRGGQPQQQAPGRRPGAPDAYREPQRRPPSGPPPPRGPARYGPPGDTRGGSAPRGPTRPEYGRGYDDGAQRGYRRGDGGAQQPRRRPRPDDYDHDYDQR